MKYSLAVLLCFFLAFVAKAQHKQDNGDELLALGNYSRAIEAFKSSKDSERFYGKIAKAYVAIGNLGEGIDYYKKAIQSYPEHQLYKYEYAKLLKRTKAYAKSKELLEDLIVLDSLNPNFYYELGLVLEKQNDSMSRRMFKKVFQLDETHQKALFKIAKHHIFKRRFIEAHRILDKGLQHYSKNIELISLKAQAYYFQEHYANAVIWFKKLLDLGEKSEFIYERLSLSHAHNSDYDAAILYRKKALNYSPTDAKAIFVIGSYYQRLNQFNKAEDYYKKALLIQDVSLAHEYKALGFVLNRQKKYKEAISAYQNAQKEDPSDIMTTFYIIRAKDEYYEDIDAKLRLYEDFLKKHSKSPLRVFAEQRIKVLKQEQFLKNKTEQ